MRTIIKYNNNEIPFVVRAAGTLAGNHVRVVYSVVCVTTRFIKNVFV